MGNLATSVKSFDSEMQGAPSLAGLAGSGIGLFDAVCVDGFGLLSLTSLTVLDGVATATISGGHEYKALSVLAIAGSTPGALNGQKRLSSVSPTTFTFAAQGVPNGAATGAITAKVAPLGMEKVFAGTNVAVYKSLDPTSFATYLRVDDTGANTMRVRGYESMLDAMTGTGPYPTPAQAAGAGAHWPKSNVATSMARRWQIVGDERCFYFNALSGDSAHTGWAVFWGDAEPYNSTDQFAAGLVGSTDDYNDYGSTVVPNGDVLQGAGLAGLPTFPQSGVMMAAREYHGLGGAVGNGMAAYLSAEALQSGRGAFPFPHPIDNSLLVCPVFFGSGYRCRGRMPGLYHCPQNLANAGQPFSFGDRVDTLGGELAGRVLVTLRSGANYTVGNDGSVGFVDIVGPWRGV